jgi:opine dehydrogenase
MYGNLAHDKLVDSGDWHEKLDLDTHRYMAEDVEIGLSLLSSVCRWAGIPSPTADGLLHLSEVAAARDFSRTGRTLENLGLASLTRAEMAQLLAEGL